MFCPKCGQESRDDFAYCPKCGLSLDSIRSQISPDNIKNEPQGNKRQNLSESIGQQQSMSEAESKQDTCAKPIVGSSEKLQSTATSNASTWARFFARFFDLYWESTFLVFILASFSDRFAKLCLEMPELAFATLFLPFVLMFDALFCWLNGNSLGKSMLGLGILHNGKRLTFGQYFSRNFALWVSAFACGIPILHLYTMISQYERLKAGQPASYDEKNSFNVCAKPTGWLRKITFGSVFFSIIVFVFVISHSVDYGLARKEPANVAENKLQVSFPLRATPTISAVAASDSLPIILSVDVATSEAIEVVSDIASAPEPPKLGRFNLGEFIATSRDEDLHYIKIVVEVGYIGDLEKELEAHKEALRDCVTNILMKLTIQRAKEDYIDRFLHKDIERELNRILNRSKSESRIISVFIPTFLIN